jgi:hypothetical protein
MAHSPAEPLAQPAALVEFSSMDLLLQAPVVVVADNKHQHLNPLLVQEEQMEQAHNRCCQHQEQAVAAAPVAPVAEVI